MIQVSNISISNIPFKKFQINPGGQALYPGIPGPGDVVTGGEVVVAGGAVVVAGGVVEVGCAGGVDADAGGDGGADDDEEDDDDG